MTVTVTYSYHGGGTYATATLSTGALRDVDELYGGG